MIPKPPWAGSCGDTLTFQSRVLTECLLYTELYRGKQSPPGQSQQVEETLVSMGSLGFVNITARLSLQGELTPAQTHRTGPGRTRSSPVSPRDAVSLSTSPLQYAGPAPGRPPSSGAQRLKVSGSSWASVLYQARGILFRPRDSLTLQLRPQAA